MAEVIFSTQALSDIERAYEFLAPASPRAGARAVAAITSAVGILEEHPLIGRETASGLRELVISHGATGYVALYWLPPEKDEVWILSIRHQRELDYPE